MSIKIILTDFILLLFLTFGNNVLGQKFVRYTSKYRVLDTSVCQAIYDNTTSIYNNLSGNLEKQINKDSFDTEQGNYSLFKLTNTTKNEYLNLTITPGGGCCNIFKAYYWNDNINQLDEITTSHVHFITENGIHLGMSYKNFFNIFPFKMFEKIHLGEFDIYRFFGKEYEYTMDSAIYNEYIALYKFHDDTLVEFLFGRYDRWYNYIEAIMNEDPLYLKYQEIFPDTQY